MRRRKSLLLWGCPPKLSWRKLTVDPIHARLAYLTHPLSKRLIPCSFFLTSMPPS